EEHFEGHAIVQILARMDLEAGVDALVLEHIENRAPAPRQLVERRLDQTSRPLRPGIEIGPCQRARKGRVLGNAEPPRRPRRQLDLLDRPGSTRLRLSAHLRSRESVKRGVVGRMHGDQLALQMRRQLRHLEPALGQHAPHLVAVRLALGCLLEVEEPPVPAWDLHSLETEPGSPSGRKNRSRSTCSITTASPLAIDPCPRRRSFVPSSMPGGTVIMSRFSTRTSPLPPHVWQSSEGTFPLPRHTGHGRLTANPPCPNEITPRPRHSGHVETVAPGAAPLPLQVGQTSAIGSVTGTLPPSAATRNGIETVVSISSSSSKRSAPDVPRRPKMVENRSPSPPNEPRSERSKSTPPAPGAPALPPRPAPAYAP